MKFYFVFILFFVCNAYTAYENYNSVLIGDKAAGMSGAFTSLYDDPSAVSFYNPATMARLRGSSLSSAANVYHKYDTAIGKKIEFSKASIRLNQGSFKSIPASSGSVIHHGNFALGLSLLVPDYDYFSDAIKSPNVADKELTTLYQILDESLWTGGSFALNVTEDQSFGISIYYTARNYRRSILDVSIQNSNTQIINEEKSYYNNSLVYILGYFKKINDSLQFGTSFRFPSLEISGRGNYFKSTLDTSSSNEAQVVIHDQIASETRIPLKLATGISYTENKSFTIALDFNYYGKEAYEDMEKIEISDFIEHKPTLNIMLGGEYFWHQWLRVRAGIFTNYSSQTKISSTERSRPDHINMLGFSTNLGIFTSDKVSFTFGGYYTGGNGDAVIFSQRDLKKLQKSKQIFSMLVGSAYFF